MSRYLPWLVLRGRDKSPNKSTYLTICIIYNSARTLFSSTSSSSSSSSSFQSRGCQVPRRDDADAWIGPQKPNYLAYRSFELLHCLVPTLHFIPARVLENRKHFLPWYRSQVSAPGSHAMNRFSVKTYFARAGERKGSCDRLMELETELSYLRPPAPGYPGDRVRRILEIAYRSICNHRSISPSLSIPISLSLVSFKR